MTTTAAPQTLRDIRAELESDWKLWLPHFFDPYLRNRAGEMVPFAAHHREFWDAMWAIRAGQRPTIHGAPRDAIFCIWPRGHGKSTSTEMAAGALAAMRRRRYGLYVSDTQPQADDHVQNVANMLTSDALSAFYPAVAERRIEKHTIGSWRRNRVQTESGFTLDAIGLEKAVRGLKQQDQRPDLVILDDIDDINDSAAITERKMKVLARSILPAASEDAVIIMVQNLILQDGIMERLVAGRADALRSRWVSGPHPAIGGLKYEGQPDGGWKITGGRPTWSNWNVEMCQRLIDRIGLESFLAECQHNLKGVSDLVYPEFEPSVHQYLAKDLPAFEAVFGGVDFGGEGRTANESAGIVGGLEPGGRLLLLAEFKDNGANVDQRLMEWMRAQEMRWQGPGSIQWAGDASEDMGIRLMRRSGFHIRMSKRGGRTPMRERRVSLVSARLAKDGAGIPALRYLRQLRRWEAEMLRYRRAKPAFEGDPRRREIIAVDDHLMTATQYMIELVDGPQAPAGDSREAEYAEVLH